MQPNELDKVTPEPEAAPSRRDFLKVATTATAGLLAGAATVAGARNAEAAGGAKAAAGYKSANGIPVPKAEAEQMLAGTKFPPGTVLAPGRVIGANDRINVAFVGTGGMGGAHVHHFADDYTNRNIQIVGICDLYEPRRTANKAYAVSKGAATEAGCMADSDYRKLLENKGLDAVVIATPEHWHAQVAVHAMQAGKHIYCQKPVTRYIDEAFQVHDTALATKRTVQVGSQGCSDARWATAGEAIREGKIGAIVTGQSSYTRNSSTGEWNYAIDATADQKNLDWERWLGSAPSRPWTDVGGGAADGTEPTRDDSKSRFFRYRKYRDYSAGILGDLAPHRLHPFLLASGNPEYPTRVTAVGTRIGVDREVDDTVQVLATFPSNWSMLFIGSTVNEQGLPDMIRGHKATIYFGNAVDLKPERPYADEIDAVTLPLLGPTGEPHERHEQNWLDCIRNGKTPNCNIDLATKVQTIISLAEMSLRTGKSFLFDEKTRTYRAA
jgi:predicted dehydrogenase